LITEKTLPQEIKEIALRYKEDKEKLDVFLVKVVVNDFGHYIIRYTPTKTSLVIRENGEVLPFNQAAKPVLISVAIDRAADTLQYGRLRWKNRSNVRVLKGIKNTVKHFMEKYQKNAPFHVQKSMEVFMKLPDKILEHQHMIDKCIDEGIEYIKNVVRQKIVTEDQFYQIKNYRNDMLRHGYWQNEVQFQTEEDRDVVLRYLDSKISPWNMFDRPVYWYLRFQNRNLLSKKKYPNEVLEMEKFRKYILEDLPLLKKEETQQILAKCKNPR